MFNLRAPSLCLFAVLAACGGDDDASTTKADQTPPQGAKALEAWLSTGIYKSWQCESAVHASRDPSPHSFNRICSNDLISNNATSASAWPKGAAAVKELYASADGKTPVGYAVYLKTDADSADGKNWYWYERVPPDALGGMFPDGMVADGMGSETTSNANKICVGCHVAAGSDAAHTPSAHGRDEVYTPVM